MPTPTMSDEELDALFRRGAEAYPNDMPAAAWARMSATLDDEARTQQLRQRVTHYFAGELLLIALLLWQVARLALPASSQSAQPHPPVGQRAAAGRVPSAVVVGPASAAGLLRGGAGQAKQAAASPIAQATQAGLARVSQPEQLTFASAAGGGRLATSGAATTSRRTHSGSLAVTVPRSTSAAPRLNEPRLIDAENIRKKRRINYLDNTIATSRAKRSPSARPAGAWPQTSVANTERVGRQSALPVHKAKQSHLFSAEQSAESKSIELIELLAGRAASLPIVRYPLPDSLRPLAAQRVRADSAEQPLHPAPRPPYRVVVGLLAGPSWSGVRTARTAQLGADYGLTLEYLFSTRLRLRVGLLSSQKNYQAANTDYVAPANWKWQPGKYNLLASCRITELPLDLRFDVRRRPTYAVFTSLGINSLLMRNEHYSYDWVMNGQTYTKSAEVVKGSTHFLSVLNVAVGLEKSLGQRWSAQVEPFWQFPLGGVGAGQVRLTSAGAYFSLKYGLLR